MACKNLLPGKMPSLVPNVGEKKAQEYDIIKMNFYPLAIQIFVNILYIIPNEAEMVDNKCTKIIQVISLEESVYN